MSRSRSGAVAATGSSVGAGGSVAGGGIVGSGFSVGSVITCAVSSVGEGSGVSAGRSVAVATGSGAMVEVGGSADSDPHATVNITNAIALIAIWIMRMMFGLVIALSRGTRDCRSMGVVQRIEHRCDYDTHIGDVEDFNAPGK